MSHERQEGSLGILDGIEHDELSSFLAEDEWLGADLTDNWLDTTQDYNPPQYTIKINGVPLAPLKGLHAITGQPGNGKTMTIVQLIAGLLGNKSNGIEYNLDGDIKPKVLYIDTEQEEENTMLVHLRVCALLGRDFKARYDDFRILWLREEISAMDRWKKTLKAIYDVRPTTIFLDGVLDVINDFNDNKECQSTMLKCMALASRYKASMWILLHENPKSDKMVGHAGSYLERKATDILQTVKSKDKDTGKVTFTVTQKKARGKDVDDYNFLVTDEQFSFGIPIAIEKKTFDPDEEFNKIDKIMKAVAPSPGLYSKTAIRDAVKKKVNIRSQSATDLVNRAIELGILKYKNDKLGYIGVYDGSANELPF